MDALDTELARDAAANIKRAREQRAFQEKRRHNIRCTVAWLATAFFPIIACIALALLGWITSDDQTNFTVSEYGSVGLWLTGLITISLGVYATGVGCRSW